MPSIWIIMQKTRLNACGNLLNTTALTSLHHVPSIYVTWLFDDRFDWLQTTEYCRRNSIRNAMSQYDFDYVYLYHWTSLRLDLNERITGYSCQGQSSAFFRSDSSIPICDDNFISFSFYLYLDWHCKMVTDCAACERHN